MNEATCRRKPGNGDGLCVRDDEFEEIHQEQASHSVLLKRFQDRVTEEFLSVFGALSRVETKIDRLVEGVEIGQVRAAQVSRDWELDEDTSITGPSEWATRARNEAMRATVETQRAEMLAAELAGLKATLVERDRQSDRVRADKLATVATRNDRLKILAGVVVAVLTSSTGAYLLARLLGG